MSSAVVWVPGNAGVANASRVTSVQPFFTYYTVAVVRSRWAPRKAPEYPTRRHSSRNDRKPSMTFLFTLSYMVSKVLSKAVADIVIFTYSGDRMPTKTLKPSLYRIRCGLRLMQHQMT